MQRSKARTTKRSGAFRSTGTQGSDARYVAESITQTTTSLNPITVPQSGVDYYGQTTASLAGAQDVGVEVATQADMQPSNLADTVEFGVQTTTSIDIGRESYIEDFMAPHLVRHTTPKTVNFGVQTEAESNFEISPAASMTQAESEALEYDSEIDPALVGRVKKLTKLRAPITDHVMGAESSFELRKFPRQSELSEDDTLKEAASLESQAGQVGAIPTSGGGKNTTEISSTAQNNDERSGGRSPEKVTKTDNISTSQANLRREQSSSTSLSSEPYMGSGMPNNLELGNGFLYMIIPPDGGYGWLIVLISFLCQVIVDGIVFSIGILLPYMAEDFGETQTTIVLVASVQVGPIASAFINKYGFRPVGLAGAICSITVITIATFSPNLPMLIFFYSVLGGPSLSLIWVSSQLIIGYYFERYRPIANGVSCSGAGAGICLFSFMNAELCPILGWRNTSRIHTAFLVCVLFMAITFIEVTPTRIATVEKDTETSSSDESLELFSQVRYSQFYASRFTMGKTNERGLEQMLEAYEPEHVRTIEKICPCCYKRKREATSRRSSDTIDPENYDNDTASRKTLGGQHYVLRVDPIEREDLFFTGPAVYDSEDSTHTHSSRRTTAGHRILLDERRARSAHYSLSVARAQRQQQPRRYTISELKNRHKNPYLAYISPRNWMPAKLFNAFAKLFDVNMLKIMEFRILLLSAFLFPMGFNIPFVYSKIRAEIDDFNRSLISPSIGFSNFVFRILSGFAANKYRSQTTYMCGGGIVFGGVATLMSAFYGENVVWFQYTYAVCYGVAPAFFSTLRAIIYVRTLGLDKLTNAFGLTGLAMGFGVFVGTTTAAILNGWTHSYNAAFGFSGICLIAAGGLKLILPTIVQYKLKHEAVQMPSPKK